MVEYSRRRPHPPLGAAAFRWSESGDYFNLIACLKIKFAPTKNFNNIKPQRLT